jgi:murein DD-endopeptidase MepM/ murein hydrolase activator NlpD
LKQKGRSFKPILLVFVVLLVCIPTVWLAVVRMEGKPPETEIGLESIYVGASRTVTLSVSDSGSGVRKISMSLLTTDGDFKILQRTFPSAGFFAGGKEKSVSVTATVSPEALGVSDGVCRLRVTAWDYALRNWGQGNRGEVETKIHIDTQLPDIHVISRRHNLNQGGSGVLLYRLSEDCPVSGVAADDRFYPGYAGHFDDPSIHMAFFALDYTQGKQTKLAVIAEDHAGNRAKAGFDHHIKARSFRKDTIKLSDRFFDAKMPDFERFFPDSAGLLPRDLFLKVNRELRSENADAIYKITQKSENEIMWEGPFLRLPGSANRARFADHRYYFYGGKEIDQQDHMGIDLASTAHAKVPAANRGKVAFTGDQGIYGNTVILDHGFGLFSLYAHLSQIHVTEGQMLEMGEIIGNTGKTGLAGGDHLHYAMLVHQTYVNPVEWWDEAWIANNITSNINGTGP